jgi:hypothetical protein
LFGLSVRPQRETIIRQWTLIASERDHCETARRRAQWLEHQGRIHPSRRWRGVSPESWIKASLRAPRLGAVWPAAAGEGGTRAL